MMSTTNNRAYFLRKRHRVAAMSEKNGVPKRAAHFIADYIADLGWGRVSLCLGSDFCALWALVLVGAARRCLPAASASPPQVFLQLGREPALPQAKPSRLR